MTQKKDTRNPVEIRRAKNKATLLALLALIITLFFVTIVKIKTQQ